MSIELMTAAFESGAEVSSASFEVSSASSEIDGFDPDKRIDTSNSSETSETYDPDNRIDSSESKNQEMNVGKEYNPDDRIELDNIKEDTYPGSIDIFNTSEYINNYVESNNERKSEQTESKVNGGSYSDVKKNSNGETHEVHHMPADAVSYIDRDDGPAIKMEKDDHRQTASCGCSREAREYRAAQKELIDNGKFREALQMDIDDIHEKFGSKYDKAISEMLEYVDKLEAEGII